MQAPSTQAFLDDSPAGLRRVALLLYGLVLPPFVGHLAATSTGLRRELSLAAVLLLCGVSAIWMWLRRSPRSWEWIFPVGVVPTISCGIAFAASGEKALGFVTILAAPLAWAAVLCEGYVVLAAWAAGTVTTFLITVRAAGLGAGLANAALFAVIQGLVASVVHGKSAHHRKARLRSLERQLNDIEILVGRDGIIADANDRAAEGYGYPREELLGRHVRDLLLAADRGRVEGQIEALLLRGALVFETEHVRRDGSTFPVEVSARACRLGGQPYLHGVIRDISARRAAETQRRFVETLFAHMTEGVIVLDESFRVKIWTPGAERVFGWSAGEVMGRSLFEFMIPKESEAETVRAITAAAAGEVCTRTMRRHRKDGAEITTSVSIVAVPDATGAITGMMGVTRDITEQQRAESALRESEARLTLALAASDTEIWEWDRGSEAVRIGARWSALLGVLQGRLPAPDVARLVEIVHPDDSEALIRAVREHVGGATASIMAEVRIPLPDGSLRWANLRGRVVARGRDGAPERVLGTVRDVTGRRAAEEERRQLLAEARRANEAREKILAVVAHDLRNPLAAIAAAAQGLEESTQEPDPQADLRDRRELIQSAAGRMNRLIADLLDEAAIRKGSLRLSPELNEPLPILGDAARAAEPLAREAGVTLVVEGDEHAPVRCDRGRILQALGNLISNACHATPAGGTVTLRLERAGEELRFTVQDTGRGLEQGAAEKLFEPYQRGAGSSYKGVGLGLAIARGIVDGHGGRIWAERPPEGGAAFRFSLPVEPALAQDEGPLDEAHRRRAFGGAAVRGSSGQAWRG